MGEARQKAVRDVAPGVRAVLIAGPTASGKSALAMRLAAALDDAVIVNADSMQVYRDLRLVTARPSPADEAAAAHRLFGTYDGAAPYSASHWLTDVRAVIEEKPGATFLFVGGTGLYFRALTEGLSPMPPVPDTVRADVRARLAREGSAALHGALDPRMADQLSPTDSQRVARALEVLTATGVSLADWQDKPGEGALVDAFAAQRVVLAPPRDWLEARIRARCEIMVSPEAFTEVERLLARGLSDELPVMRAIGVSVLTSYVNGELDRTGAVEALSVQTRRYAKRQETWFRGQMTGWLRLNPACEPVEVWVDACVEALTMKEL